MARVAATVIFLGILWTLGLVSLWRQRAWKAIAAFAILMTLGTVMSVVLATGVMVLPWSQWVTTIFEPLARLLFGQTIQE